MSRTLSANTLIWLRDKPYDAGTVFAVADKPDPAATKPVQVDAGTADLWVREGKAAAVAPAKKPG